MILELIAGYNNHARSLLRGLNDAPAVPDAMQNGMPSGKLHICGFESRQMRLFISQRFGWP
jgi:hypothetical protein